MSIGNLISKFCQKKSCKPNQIKEILDKFAKKIGNCKPGKGLREDVLVSILKGLRNSDNVVGTSVDKLIQCSNDKHSLRVRVAAIQAFRAGSCDKKIQTSALDTLKNRNEDSELRIEAYLALASCANAQVAKSIKTLLDDEPSNQVGSFITSHIASLRASTDAHRQQARAHLVDIRSSKKFPSDFRQYSFNRELSYTVNSLGIGASLDADVIYSQKSFLPRSIRTNFTGAIFGNEFNILELQGRQENLELLLEHTFGPKGTIRTTSNQELVNSLIKAFGDGGKRERRGLKEDTEAIAKQANGGNVNHDIDLDLSIKMFGSELYFLSLSDNIPLDGKGFLERIKKSFDKASDSLSKGVDYTYESHSLFLDSSFVYPTGVGLPLKFVAQGAGVVRLQTSGKIDLKGFRQNPSFKLKLVPRYVLLFDV